jgi:uncharacterized membrane protein
MSISDTATTVAVDPRHITWTHVMYALHAVGILIGVLTAASIVGNFVFGLPSIVAIIMNYVRRPEIKDTWLDSHFRWQRRTFWYVAIPSILIAPLVVTIILIPFVMLAYLLLGVWAAYRIIRGWLALNEGRTMPAGSN